MTTALNDRYNNNQTNDNNDQNDLVVDVVTAEQQQDSLLLSTPVPSKPLLSIEEIVTLLRSNIGIQDRKKYFTTYKLCFLGNEMIDYCVTSNIAATRTAAIDLGNVLINDYHIIEHVTQRDTPLMDSKHAFYRFVYRGHIPINPSTGSKYNWSDYIATPSSTNRDVDSESKILKMKETTTTTTTAPQQEQLTSRETEIIAQSIWPHDAYNIELLNNVHPVKWKNPPGLIATTTVTSNTGSNTNNKQIYRRNNSYDLVVIGGGTGGLITAAGSAGVGARVALIEEYYLGGDCLNVGCIPSKTLIHSANLFHTVRHNEQRLQNAGITIVDASNNVQVNFTKVMERVRQVRSKISHHDSAERYSKELGVHIYMGRGTFTSNTSIWVEKKLLNFKRAVIATGGAPLLLTEMDGFQELYDQCNTYYDWNKENQISNHLHIPPRPMVLTNETIFNLTQAPKKLIVIGTGVIGIELAQAMQRLGISTTVLGRSGRQILNKEDEDLSSIVKEQMIVDGVEFRLHVVKYIKIELTGTVYEENGLPEMKLTIQESNDNGSRLDTTELVCDAVLVAIGRRPNVDGMNLDLAHVQYDSNKGLIVNDKLQTTNKRIYGVGDCCYTNYQYTHAADFMARIVIRNALFFGRDKLSSLIIPHATFTSPEIATVGYTEMDLKSKNIPYRIIEKHFINNDRSITDDMTQGLVRIRIHHKTDQIYGATIVGTNAGNMINEITFAIQMKVGLGTIASIIHPYPTSAEVIRQCGDLYSKTRLTSTVKRLLRTMIQLQR